MISRTAFCIGLGVLLTPAAGYIGALTMPLVATVWFISLLFGIAANWKAGLFMLAVPALAGAEYAWPVTCVLLPLAARLMRPAPYWAPFAFALIGAVGGIVAVHAASLLPRIFLGPQNRFEYVVAGTVAGMLLGCLYGFALWRFDTIRATKG